MLVKVIRAFEAEHANGVTRRLLTRVVDTITLPRRGERLQLPDLDEALAVDRVTVIASLPERSAPVASTPRCVVAVAVESGDGYDRAGAVGWRAL